LGKHGPLSISTSSVEISAALPVVRLALSALILALLTTAASAQYALDAKGRRYKCLPGDWSCSVLPPPGAPLQPLPRTRSEATRPLPQPDQCGSRCDLLDRMK